LAVFTGIRYSFCKSSEVLKKKSLSNLQTARPLKNINVLNKLNVRVAEKFRNYLEMFFFHPSSIIQRDITGKMGVLCKR
jgi:hypothetical protein